MISYENKINSEKDRFQKLIEFLNTTEENIDEIKNKSNQIKNETIFVSKNLFYQNVKNFIQNDTTNDPSKYNETSYNCVHYSKDVNNNAEKKGIRCGYVIVDFNESYRDPHSLVVFMTKDKGLIFFEPQTDEEVNLTVGEEYWKECVISHSENDYNNKDNWRVKSYTIYW